MPFANESTRLEALSRIDDERPKKHKTEISRKDAKGRQISPQRHKEHEGL